jgi:trimeric autotransporter adhesin
MLGLDWGGSEGRVGNGRGRRQGRRPIGRGARRRDHRPYLEALELRLNLSAGTATWTGLGTDNNWMTADNWSGDVAPQSGYDLVFPAGAAQISDSNNNFPASTSFNSITIESSGYALTGNAVQVASDIDTTYTTGTSSDTIATDLVAGTVSVASGGTLDLGGVISGSSGLGLSGGGTLDLQALNTYTGTTTITGSTTTLLVDGTITGTLTNSGVLGGNGTVGDVSSVGGTVGAGDPTGPGMLTTTGTFTLDSNSQMVVRIDSNSVGNGSTGYDQIVTGGVVDLEDPTLDVTLATGYAPPVGDQFEVIENNSPGGGGSANLSGNFANLLEGAAITESNTVFRITYSGGAKDDSVVLTSVSQSTTTTLAASSNSITYGQSVTVTATVKGSGGTAPSSGSVEFYNGNPNSGGNLINTVSVNGSGVATDSLTSLNVVESPNNIYAVFVPDTTNDTYAGSVSAPQVITVTPITLTVSGITANNKTYDGTTAATLNTSSATLNGVLPRDTVTLDTSGAVVTFSSPDVGTNIPVSVTGLTISGSAAGDYVLTQPTGLTADITAAPLTLTADNQTIDQGQALPDLDGQFTATGLVDGQTIDQALTTQPTLSYTVSSSDVPGTSPIDIGNASAPNYAINYVSGTLNIIAVPATTTTVSSSSPLAVANQPVTFTALVASTTSGAATPTGGVVVFYADDSPIGESTLSNGVATFTTSTLSYGSHSIVAVYEGNDTLFQGSTSSAITEYITAAGTAPTLTVEAVRNRHGKIVAAELVANIGVISPGSGTPEGNVIFFVNGRASYQVAPVIDGTATLALLPPRVTNKFIFVRYLGYYNIFQPSVSTSQLVSQRSLAKAPSVRESVSLTRTDAKSTADVHHTVEVVKVIHNRDDRRRK